MPMVRFFSAICAESCSHSPVPTAIVESPSAADGAVLNASGYVVARRLATVGRKEALIGHLPMTGEELPFVLDEIDHFQVID